MPYLELLIAALAALGLAAIADQLTGRRGFLGTSLVSGVGAVCGWFLAVRVFAVTTTDDWDWILWSVVASIVCLGAFFIFRSKR
ncbi:transglycosylase [Rhizobium sp. CRIBSB]|nr:transglycosylase [Rhizobium sp. CRIBSB]